jgi:hypothetical protein
MSAAHDHSPPSGFRIAVRAAGGLVVRRGADDGIEDVLDRRERAESMSLG